MKTVSRPMALIDSAMEHLDSALLQIRAIQDELPWMSSMEIGSTDEVITYIEQAIDRAQHLRGNHSAANPARHPEAMSDRKTPRNDELMRRMAGQSDGTHLVALDKLARALERECEELREMLTAFAYGRLDVSETAVILGYQKAETALTAARRALAERQKGEG